MISAAPTTDTIDDEVRQHRHPDDDERRDLSIAERSDSLADLILASTRVVDKVIQVRFVLERVLLRAL